MNNTQYLTKALLHEIAKNTLVESNEYIYDNKKLKANNHEGTDPIITLNQN
jgi:hypothetical protein